MHNATHNIDFLPVQYRKRRVRRQSQPWRVVAVVAFGVLLAAAVLSQKARQSRADKELATVIPQYELAVDQNRELAELQIRLTNARSSAELFTYLRHPWPRTQLLAAVLAPLPEEITLEQIEIAGQAEPDRARPKRRSRQESEVEDRPAEKRTPAASDLQRLRHEFDDNATEVLISGTTSNSAAVHRYLGDLGRSTLFIKAELDSLESAENHAAGVLKFDARLLVRKGYGQPGGPTGRAVAQTTGRHD